MFVTGPEVVKTVTHEEVTAEELGGAGTHTSRSGVADLAFENDVEAILMLRRFYNYLPLNNREKPPVRPSATAPTELDHSLDTLVPDNPNKPYDIKELILKVVDDGDFFELQPEHAKNIVIGFGRMDGPDGRHRGQPAAGAGRLPGHQEQHQGRALRALLRLLQHPDGDVGRRARLHARHQAGIRRHHQARRQAAVRLRRATVPKVTVITRKAYGGAYDVMSSKHLRGDVNFAWPNAEIAVMGAKGAVEIIFREEKKDPAKLAEREAEYKARFANPFVAGCARLHRRRDPAARDPQTHLPFAGDAASDKKLENPWRKHGNIPL